MAVNGSYIEWRVRGVALAQVRAYGECVLREIMPIFANLNDKAESVATAEYERLGSEPVGDSWDGDMGSLAEAAHDKGLAYYETMTGLRQAVLNLFAVGLFHLVEQELADLCRDASFDVEPPRDTQMAVVADWYRDHFGLDLSRLRTWSTIDELRLVANASKHAEGTAARQLRERRPELFHNPVLRERFPGAPPSPWPIFRPLAGEDLYVTPQVLQQYVEAAVTFASEVAAHFEQRRDEYYPR